MHIAVVFPRANRRAGVERVAWDLSNQLAQRHKVTFVGIECEAADENRALFHQLVTSSALPAPYDFRRAAKRALTSLRPDVTISLGVNCPAGEMCWVQSVHKAYLHIGVGAIVRGWPVPGSVRWLLPRHQLLLAAERTYFRSGNVRRIMCTSPRELRDVVSLYDVDPERCVVVPNGYDPTIFEATRAQVERQANRNQLGIGAGVISFLFVANELHRKGFGTLIEAFARAELTNARLDVVGRVGAGDYASKIAKLGLDEKVHWHGPTSDVFSFYAAADVMVFPTLYEPFGIVIVEALAAGLPVITSRLAGASAAVEDGDAGLVLDDPANPDELARCLRAAIDDRVRSSWAAKAPAAAAPYAWPRIMAGVEQILESVVLEKDS